MLLQQALPALGLVVPALYDERVLILGAWDLELDGHVATGTWTEQTATEGHHRGARYHGAIQLLVEPTGRRMTGKWVGFGKEFDVNTGAWELVFQDASTNKVTLAAYDCRPDA